MACESCKKLLELLDKEIEQRRRSAKPGEWLRPEPMTQGKLAELLNLALNGPAPAPEPKKTRTVTRVIHSPMMQKLVDLRKEHAAKIAGLSEEDAAKLPKGGGLGELEWQFYLSRKGQGLYANQFSSGIVQDEVEETDQQSN
jgi:hypothetical protein